MSSSSSSSSSSSMHRSLEGFVPLELSEFKGQPWRSPQTIEAVPVVATSFGVCEMHKIRTEDGQELDGWLWFDEKDQINVLAQIAARENEEEEVKKFLVFEQMKYGYEGKSLAPIGGLIEPGEQPEEAAKRELLEEAGLVSDAWVYFGRYRISSTRGGGFLNVFLARDCRPAGKSKTSDDMEKQTKLYLTEEEIAEKVLKGAFKEAKWTQTVAMGLLWLTRQKLLLGGEDPSAISS